MIVFNYQHTFIFKIHEFLFITNISVDIRINIECELLMNSNAHTIFFDHPNRLSNLRRSEINKELIRKKII